MAKSGTPPTLTIKLKPQYQDYIRYLMMMEGYATMGSVIKAYRASYLGKLISPFLTLQPRGAVPLIGHTSEYFTFYLPFYDRLNVRNNTAWISPENQKHIEAIVDAHFRFHFITYALDKSRYLRQEHTAKGSIQKVIISFCHDVNIQYDAVTYEMIEKAFYRARKKMDKNFLPFSSKRELIGHLFFLI
jgi:hypothetical protein